MSHPRTIRSAPRAASSPTVSPSGGAHHRSAVDALTLLICPICALPLRRTGTALACERRHSFDVARAGYVNLLLRQRPGDTRAMLLARRAFLARGHYDRLSSALTESVAAALASQPHVRADRVAPCILDAGCGEGHYLRRVHHTIVTTAGLGSCRVLGTDVSPAAVQLAAKQAPQAGFFVADIRQQLYVPDASIDALLTVFAPRNVAEFARVVAPGRHVICVLPTPQHLGDLRQRLPLLAIEAHKHERVAAQFTAAFRLIDDVALEYQLALQRADVVNLITMSPNYWHIHDPEQQAARLREPITTMAGFRLLVYQRR